MVHQDIKTVKVFGYLSLIGIDFIRFHFSVFSLVFVSIETTHQTLKTVFDHISKHLKVRQKYSAVRRISNFSVYVNVVKHGLSCLICYLST